MNILWFLDKEFDASLSTSARLATIKFLEQSHDILVVTNFRKKKRYDQRIKSTILYLEKIDLPIVKTAYLYYQHLRLLNQMDLKNIDIIMVNSYNAFLLKKLIRLRPHNNYRMILDIRTLPVETSLVKNEIYKILFGKCLKIAAKSFDGITYITDEMRQFCQKKYHLFPHRSCVWSSGVDIEIFKPLDHPRKDDRFRIMYHGVMTEKRGIKNVLKALSLLREYNVDFFLLGSGQDLPALKKYVEDRDLENRVFIYPPVSHELVPEFIASVDAGIVPLPHFFSWNVSSPIKVFEYLACGKPVIVTRIPAHLGILNGKTFAFWAEESNPECIAKAVLDALKNKNHLLGRGQEARHFIELNYTWEKQVSKLDSFLRDV